MEKLKKIIEKSSLPGIPRIISNYHYLIQIIWFLSVIGFTSLSIYYLVINVISYLSYSFVTNIALISETLPQFPAISFCFSSQNQIPSLKNNMIQCSFDLSNCDYQDFELYSVNLSSVNYFETCLRFNTGKNYSNQPIEINNITRTNVYTGLYLSFIINDFIFDIFNYSTVFKLRVSIDNNTSYFNRLQVYNQNMGINIPAGFTQIQIEREFIQNLAQPYNNCVKQDSENISEFFQYFLKNHMTYTQNDCINVCIIKFIMNKCNCNLEIISLQICFNNIEISNCILEYYYGLLNKTYATPARCFSSCPSECNSINYKLKQNSFILTDQYSQINNYSNYYKDNYVNIAIYYPTKQYTLITQSPKMQLFDLVSSIGGILGLFIGFSFLTLIEFIDIIFKIIFCYITKKEIENI